MTLEEVNAKEAETLARLRELKVLLAKAPKPEHAPFLAERDECKKTLDALVARRQELRDAAAAVKRRRNFAGIGSPLHEAMCAALPADVVAKLEAEAERLQAERDARAEARRAAKAEQQPGGESR